jgi:hypothetical protein
MAFGRSIQHGAQRVSRFFSSQLPTAARTGLRLFSTHVVPAARQANRLISAVGDEVQAGSVGEKVKTKAKQVSSLANIGLRRLEDAEKASNRVAQKIGLT